MSDVADRAGEPREGETLDLESLEPYLRREISELRGPLVLEQFPGGYSNLTYLLRSGDLELVLRRPPFGNRVKSAHDMGREFKVLSALQGVYAQAPRPYLYCEDEKVIGAPFYVMERRRGIILRKKLPPGLDLETARVGALCRALIDNLATLHGLDYEGAGLGDLGRPEGYVERQVEGWTSRYGKARTHEWPELESVAAWLLENRPPDSGAGLVHNDYKYDNLVLDPADPTRIVGLLDWEMCTIGDPLLDLGTTLAYWVEAEDPPAFRQAAFGPTAIPGSWTRQQLADRYFEATGHEPPSGHLTFYFAFGLFKLAVIVQQIYFRYAKGFTRDPRFAHLDQMVALLGRVGAEAVGSGRI